MANAVREIGPADTALAVPALLALRPGLRASGDPGRDEAAVRRLVDQVQRPQGYRLVGVFEPAERCAQAVAGFRLMHALGFGRFLYVDDLSTRPAARRRGYAGQLLDWLFAESRRLGCEQLHLDSGVGPDRADAHRLYLNAGLRISAHHFAAALPRP